VGEMKDEEEIQECIADSLTEEIPDYVENNIIKFIQILRNLGIRISLAESIEVMKALKLMDIINKEEIRITLRSLLVKTNYEKEIFDKAFESFFVDMEEKIQQQQMRKKEIAQKEEAKREAEEDLKFEKESIVDDDKDEEVQLNFSDEQKEIYTQLDPEIKEKIKEYIENSFPDHLSHSPQAQPILERMISGTLSYWKSQFKNKESQDPVQSKMTGDLEMDVVIEQVVSSLQEEDSSLLTQDMKDIPQEEIPKVTMIVKKLAHRLATKISRRFQRNKKIGKIDIRRTIRENIKYGGVMLDLKYQSKKVQKPEFLLICDVSDSMARYAIFVLQFIYGILSAVKNIESFIFSEDLERVSDYFETGDTFEETMAKVITKSEQWGKTTDFNQALKSFQTEYIDLLNPETIVFIMSDTKTLDVEEAALNLEKIKDKVKNVVWLNTLPKSEWDGLNSVQVFKELTIMVECYTIEHLRNSLKIQILT
jgi:hypothetical protein